MAETVTKSLVHQFAVMKPTEFGPTIEPKWQQLGGTSVGVLLDVEDVDEVVRQVIDAGGSVTMPVEDQFWGDRYGVIADPFGHQWQIATHKEDLTPEEITERGKKAMAAMS